MEILKRAAALADGIVVAVTELVQRAETAGNTYKSSDAKGSIAEVSVAIPAGGTGEVLLKLGRGLQNYPARSAQEGTAFPRGAKVRVIDVGGQTLYVEALNNVVPLSAETSNTVKQPNNENNRSKNNRTAKKR